MSADVTVKLPAIDDLIAAIGTDKLKTSMNGAATVIAGEVRKRWARGIGASNIPMDAEQPISKAWKVQKGIAGRNPIINYTYHGDFTKSFIPRQVSDDGRTVTIAFGGQSKGIDYISRDKISHAIQSNSASKQVKAIRGLGSSPNAKPVDNLKKARGLAYWRPKSFMPDDTLEVIGIKAFLKSLRAIVKFTK